MRLFPALAAVAVLAAPAALAQAVDLTGRWTADEDGRTCTVELTRNTLFGAFRASSFGCTGDLFGVSSYRVRGSEVVLLGIADRQLATLRLERAGQLLGATQSGRPVTLSRAGAPPVVAAPRGYVGPGTVAASPSACVAYGDTGRCVEAFDQQVPAPNTRVRTLNVLNLRERPDITSPVVGAFPRDVCIPVQECRVTQGVWCRVDLLGQPGWITKVVRDSNGADRMNYTNRC